MTFRTSSPTDPSLSLSQISQESREGCCAVNESVTTNGPYVASRLEKLPIHAPLKVDQTAGNTSHSSNRFSASARLLPCTHAVTSLPPFWSASYLWFEDLSVYIHTIKQPGFTCKCAEVPQVGWSLLLCSEEFQTIGGLLSGHSSSGVKVAGTAVISTDLRTVPIHAL